MFQKALGERINKLKDRSLEKIQVAEERNDILLNEEVPQELSDSIRKGNIGIMSIPEKEERVKGTESLLK